MLAACHLKNYFVITYLLEDEQELRLGMLIRCKHIYNFLCSMLVLHQFLYVLFTLRCTFMHFLELTYCQHATVPVPIFCCFCISEKLYRKYSRNGTKWKPKFLFFPTRRQSPKQRQRRAPRWPHHVVARATPGSATMWCEPLGRPPTLPFCLFIAFFGKTLNISASIHEKFCSRSCRHPSSGDRNLCSGTLSRRGIAPRAISIDPTAIFIAVAVSHDEEGVVLPRGWGLYR